MNSWSRRRKLLIFLIVFAALVILVGLPVYLLFYKAPTCFDGKFNGGETGVDCGGSCQLLCTAESLPLIVQGDPQVLQVATDIFEVVVLVENPNTSGEIYRADYTLKLYDATSTVPIKVVDGGTYIPKNSTVALFEGPFTIENKAIPTRATFEWKEGSLIWRKNNTNPPELIVKNLNLSRASSTPRLDAQLENVSLENVYNLDLTALIFNETGTIFAASKTFIDVLIAGESSPVVFTWPRPFSDKVIDVDIIVRILPDRSFIR